MPRAVVRVFAVRALMLWLAMRALLVFVASGPELLEGRVVVFGAELAPAVAVLTGACSFIDTARRGERALWGNLAISQTAIALVFVAAAIACEGVLALVRL